MGRSATLHFSRRALPGNLLEGIAAFLGQVEAADAETAIKAAIKKYDVEPEHQDRLAARRIVAAE